MKPQKLVSFSASISSVPGGGRTVRVSATTESGTVYTDRLVTPKAMGHRTADRICRFFRKIPPVWAGSDPGNEDTVLLWEEGPIRKRDMSGKNSLNAFIESMI